MDIEFGKLASAAMPIDLSVIVSALLPLGLDERAIKYAGDFPNLSGLCLDLTGAHFHRGTSLQDIPDGEPAFTVRKVTANAAPAYFEALPFIFAMQAEDAAFSSKLVLIRSGKGTLDLSASIADIESALLNYVRSAAEKQGTEAELQQED